MTRTKHSAKRHRDNTGASSSRANPNRNQQPIVPYQPQFRDNAQKEKFEELMQRRAGKILFPHLPTLEKAGIQDEVMQLLSRDWWQHLFFGINEPTYKEITCEVLSSFKAPREITNSFYPVIKFRAFGEDHVLSANDISSHLGFERLDDVARWDGSLLDFPKEVNQQQFWESITINGGRYNSQTSPSTVLHPLKYRVIHALLSSTVSGRAEKGGKVSSTDFFCLYCMIHGRRPIFGALFAGLFARQASYRVKELFAGPYITRMMKAMGYGDRLEGMTVVEHIYPMETLPKEIPAGRRAARHADDDDGGAEGHQQAEQDDAHEMMHGAPVLPPPQGHVFPNSWEGMHQHIEDMYGRLYEHQQQFFTQMSNDVTAGFSSLDLRMTSLEQRWDRQFPDDQQPPPPPF
ncbi:unnamed protein product [Cuscuta epithymum]|uniref:Uncharacterized protein n=4 Tax=Cuscuta epithymum TaxID=186058 RepID=A0AAV0CQA4_9ASTE|nr:unnamed protein product [Cuscuta epithymum]